jgi:small subunit ribosomal protein S5
MRMRRIIESVKFYSVPIPSLTILSDRPSQATRRLNSRIPRPHAPRPILDPKDVIDFPPTEDNPFHNRVIVYNHRSVFDNYSDEAIFSGKGE